ncbi:MAG TPA: efflux RND transporter periplasmic adaptor subunit [Terriglobales bacterium]|nr:efflux RND transporter periplasmic adaptor subunit [Terriglobales bacterium]
MKNLTDIRYRPAFLVMLFTTVALSIGVATLWWRLHASRSAQTEPSTAQTSEATPSSMQSMSAGQSATPSQPETALAPIQLSPQRMQSIGVQIGEVKYQPVNDEIRFYGNVKADERRLAYVQTHFSGWIRKLYADATGDFVRKGQPLFTIYSPDLVATEQEYLIAKKNQADLQRSSVTGVASGAASLLSAAKDRLVQWEISSSEIAKLDTEGKVITDLTINSPVSGYITEKNALPNMYVQPEMHLYTVSDLSGVWVLAQVFQNDAGKIRPGDRAEVTVDAYPGRVFAGRVDYLLPQVDITTRTLPVRLVIPNPGLKLRPGMYVNVRLRLPLGKQLIVPSSAVFHSGTRNLVFTYRGDGNIEPREVELGSRVGDQQIIAKGVREGEQIVVSANFLIDSEAQLQAAAGAFTPPPPGAGAAAAMNAPAEKQATVELTTEPSPPHKGSNTVRVKLTSSDGKPITGAQVTVTFFMPAMQEMGMAAMKTVVRASDKGGGLYEGDGDLGSGGTWQVTVTATQNGQVIVSKHLTLNATGGM